MIVGYGSGPVLNITRMIVGETGTYNDVYHRPFQTSLGDEEFYQLRERTHGFKNIESDTLALCAGTFLNPSAQPGAQINIDHGWGEGRLRFMMSIQYEGRLSNTEQIVTGYTDRADLSYSGEISPDTQFFVNNVITLRHVDRRTSTGIGTAVTMSDNFQVLRDTTRNQSSVTLRPTDVVRAQHASSALEGLGLMGSKNSAAGTFFGDDDDDTVFYDARNNFSPAETTRLSRRKNNLNANYMSSVLKAHQAASSDEGEYASEDTVFEKTMAKLDEPYSFNNPLLKTLTENTGFSENTSFTLKELRDLCPNVDKLLVFSRASKTAQVLPNQRGQTEQWGGSDNATMIANIMAATIPALAMDHLITKVWFTATNETLNGETIVELNHTSQNPPASFSSGIDITRSIRAFMDRIEHYVMRDVTRSDMVGVSVSVRYEALGDTFITVSCNGEPPVDFIIPTFCDSLFSPIMTDNSTDLYKLSSDFRTLMDYDHGYEKGPSEIPMTTMAPQWGSGGNHAQRPSHRQQQTNPLPNSRPGTLFD